MIKIGENRIRNVLQSEVDVDEVYRHFVSVHKRERFAEGQAKLVWGFKSHFLAPTFVRR